MKPENWISAMGFMPWVAMPMEMPAMRASAKGVSITRSLPKRCCRPSVARNTPPFRPTSSPSTTTDGSFSISWAMAMVMASTIVTLAMVGALLDRFIALGDEALRHVAEHMVEHALHRRLAGLLIQLHFGVHARGVLRQHGVFLLLVPGADVHEVLADAEQGLLLPLAFHLALGAVAGGVVRRGVVVQAVGEGL